MVDPTGFNQMNGNPQSHARHQHGASQAKPKPSPHNRVDDLFSHLNPLPKEHKPIMHLKAPCLGKGSSYSTNLQHILCLTQETQRQSIRAKKFILAVRLQRRLSPVTSTRL